VDGGAWPFLVRGVICQFNYGNERDHKKIIERFFFDSYSLLDME